MRRSKSKAINRAETAGGGWVGLPHVVVDSLAYRHLSMWARAVLVEIAREFNGYNNGRIGLSFGKLTERLNNSNRRKLSQAIAELVEHGLVAVEAEGEWKPRLAREYRLTFVTSGDQNHLRHATNEYKHWKPTPFSSGDGVSPVKPISGNASSPERAESGNTSSPVQFQKPRKSADAAGSGGAAAGDDVSLHIIKPYPARKTEGGLGFETPSKQAPKSGGPKSALPGAMPETLAMVAKLQRKDAA